METLLGIPMRGWIAMSIWLLVLILPWGYVLYFLRRIDASGVERWGAKTVDTGAGGGHDERTAGEDPGGPSGPRGSGGT